MTEFDCLEVTLCGQQDIKIQLLTNLWQFHCPEVTLHGWQDIKIQLLTN